MQGYQVSVIFHTPYLIRNTLPSESVGPLRRRCCLRRQCAYETRGPLRDPLAVLQEIPENSKLAYFYPVNNSRHFSENS